MDERKIVKFVKSRCEPIQDLAGGIAYRCAANLNDSLHLPCVLVASRAGWLQLARRRLQETPSSRHIVGFPLWRSRLYDDIFETFVTSGNRVNSYDIASLEESPYALSTACLHEIKGETSMSWTQFVGVMRDGKEVSFGTTYHTEFFNMPHGYAASDVVAIRPHERLSPDIFRERPFFTCFVNGL
jgi:hypothetical protein